MQNWIYLNPSDPALCELEQRIYDVGGRLGITNYSDLVKGLDFHPKISKSSISLAPWTDMNRAIIGEYLSYISIESMKKLGFMASSLVINELDGMPSPTFFKLARDQHWIKSGET